MYTTFSFNSNDPKPAARQGAASNPAGPRPKRSQVTRACEWCRLNRTKCNNEQPCRNCRNRGASCSNSKPFEASSLPAANR